MRFLRRTSQGIENAWCNDSYSARQRGHALFVLAGLVIVARHPYDRDPASGSGNCWCGRDMSSSIHQIVIDG